MALPAFESKEKVGRINIERRDGAIRLRWQLSGQRYSLTIGKICKEVVDAARAKAQQIDSDITFERFDPTLAKYGKHYSATKLEVVQDDFRTTLNMKELWQQFFADKMASNLKAKTKQEYEYFDGLIQKLGDDLTDDAIAVKQILLTRYTQDTTSRVLLALSGCCNWGIRHGKVLNNYFRESVRDLDCGKRKPSKQANAFTPDEEERILNAFKSSYDFGCYFGFVFFLFKTGCRPSEAVGLQWKHVSADCTKIMFRGSAQLIDHSPVWVEKSKNNRTRNLNSGQSLTEVLLTLRDGDCNDDDPVFPAPRTGGFIHYNNFSRRAWRSVVNPIKPGTTPYCCRDTLITEQLLKGVPSAIIAKWCDTSIKMIEEKYADELRLLAMRPID